MCREALDNFKAISGLMPHFELTISDKFLRLVPIFKANSVMDKLNGLIQSSSKIIPGCTYAVSCSFSSTASSISAFMLTPKDFARLAIL